MLEVARRTAEQVFIPNTVGGGMRSAEDIRAMLSAGSDKISLNSAVVRDPALITHTSGIYGSQCIVVAIDASHDIDVPPGAVGVVSATWQADRPSVASVSAHRCSGHSSARSASRKTAALTSTSRPCSGWSVVVRRARTTGSTANWAKNSVANSAVRTSTASR